MPRSAPVTSGTGFKLNSIQRQDLAQATLPSGTPDMYASNVNEPGTLLFLWAGGSRSWFLALLPLPLNSPELGPALGLTLCSDLRCCSSPNSAPSPGLCTLAPCSLLWAPLCLRAFPAASLVPQSHSLPQQGWGVVLPSGSPLHLPPPCDRNPGFFRSHFPFSSSSVLPLYRPTHQLGPPLCYSHCPRCAAACTAWLPGSRLPPFTWLSNARTEDLKKK